MMLSTNRTALLVLPFFLVSCWGQDKGSEEPEKSYKTLQVKDTPEVRERLEAFNAQEHRLEFTDCEMRYNGKSFFIGDTLEDVEAVLGEYDYNYGLGYIWSNVNLDLILDKQSGKVGSISIYLHIDKTYSDLSTSKYKRDFMNALKPDDDYIVINGVPLNRKMIFKEFLDSSTYSFDNLDFFKYDFSYEEENCANDDKKLTVYFKTPVPYDYEGGGHIQVRGKFRPDKTQPVDKIKFQFTYKLEE